MQKTKIINTADLVELKAGRNIWRYFYLMKKENLLKTYPSYGTSGIDYCNSRQKSLPDQTFCILIYMVNKIVIFIREKSENFEKLFLWQFFKMLLFSNQKRDLFVLDR